MRKTIYEIVNNKAGDLLETFSYPVGVGVRSGDTYNIFDDKTGEVIQFFPFSIRVRVRLVDIDEYKKTHTVLDQVKPIQGVY